MSFARGLLALLACQLLLGSGTGGGCSEQSNPAEIGGEWQAQYADDSTLEFAARETGVIRSETISGEASSFSVTSSSGTLSFDFDCSGEGAICPADVLGDVFQAEHDELSSFLFLPSYDCAADSEVSCDERYDPTFGACGVAGGAGVCGQPVRGADMQTLATTLDDRRIFASLERSYSYVNARACAPVDINVEATVEDDSDGNAIRLQGVVTVSYSALCFLSGDDPDATSLRELQSQSIRLMREFTATRTSG